MIKKSHKPYIGNCLLCNRVEKIKFHHLIPKTCHKNKWFKKNFTREEMKENGIMICDDCHKFIHKKYKEKELGRELNTLDKLQNDLEIKKFVKYIRKRK